ncbi:MAG: hypothetical protein DI535_21385 [Citrobacter freundii]|nr:MAG: hypothetical protein DI535_21385 [Citrobacter freundii]
MKHSATYKGDTLEIDFSRPGVPHSATVLKPDLIKEGGTYQCIWHSDDTDAITGEGSTPEEALQHWDQKVQQILDQTNRTDKLAIQIRDAFLQKSDQPNETRQSNDAHDVTEGIPTRSDINPENNVVKKSRKHTPDESNKDGSEFR